MIKPKRDNGSVRSNGNAVPERVTGATLPWFRMYGEFINDIKVQRMGEADQRRLVMLLCMRCNGYVTLQDDDIAFQLRISPEEWARSKREFCDRGFIDKDNNLVNWDKRQFRSDSSVERVRRHREARKRAAIAGHRDDDTSCNVTVTPPESDTDSESDTEERKNPISSELPDESPESEKENPGGDSDSLPRAARAIAKYAFEGRKLRLNQADFERLRNLYATIPDFVAELASIDAWLVQKNEDCAEIHKKPPNPYSTATRWLNRKHQENMEKKMQAHERRYAWGSPGLS